MPTKFPTSIPSLTENGIKNMAYTSTPLADFIPQSTPGKTIQLVNGEFHLKFDPNAASELVVLYVQSAFGDLNHDGTDDAAVILAVNGGGSGVFVFLVAVVNRNGKGQDVAAVQLGDRVKVNRLALQNGKISLDYLTQGPNDPLCCPTQKSSAVYMLQGNSLVLGQP
jgi:hypothetical protein